MTDSSEAIVPVWTLATGEVQVPEVDVGEALTLERLNELRNVLAALADMPIATLELHPLPDEIDLSRGIPLDAASPLAQHLSGLLKQTARASTKSAAAISGEGLYRMVVPAKVVDQLGQGIVRSMPSKAVDGGIRSALLGSTGVVSHVSFVPVGNVATAGSGAGATATASAGAAAGVAATGGVALTVAAPLVLMAIAVGASAAAENKRQRAIENITRLLDRMTEQKLDDERSELDGCRDAIDKATAILLDEGKLGISLGLDSAVHAIGKALAAADRRLDRWQKALDALPSVTGVEVETLTRSFPGVANPGGTFRCHLELAQLAIALKRRVIVLQAVEHAQTDPGNLFENFARTLKTDQQRLDELESGLGGVLVRLSSLELAPPQRLRKKVLTTGEVDRLLRSAYRVSALGDGVDRSNAPSDVAIEIARHKDGSVVVLPAIPA